MGPVMRGPSSSHTAASWRIAHAALQLLNDTLESALVEMDRRGTWAANYREQGTAMGMDGGLLGIELTDERIIRHEQIAGEANVAIEYRIGDFETDHTNTVRLTLNGSSGRKVRLIAVSTGGGMFEIRNYNGYPVKICGDSYHLFITAGATYHSGILASIAIFIYVHTFPDRFDATALNPEHIRHIALSPLAQDMAVNMFGALWSLIICMAVTVGVSLVTKPKPAGELRDLVYGLTRLPDEGPCPWYRRPVLWAGVVAAALVIVNIIFW